MSSEPLAIASPKPASVPAAPPVPAAAAVTEPSAPEAAISIRSVSKCYEIYDKPIDRLKQTLFRGRRRFYREFWALRDISFEVRRGEAVGIIGRNGSGKSTLLQIIAGTLRPTEGEVEVRGRVAALLELGSGFNPEFTGRENAYLNGAILGLSREDMDQRFDEIASFADIGAFIDMPVKTYSTGMLVRVAFAVQVQLEPDILIVDEALSVGDALFQKRCYQRIEELRARGVTLLFVSHDQETVRTLTSRALLLEAGRPRALGSSAEVVLEYRRLLHEAEREYFENLVRAGSTRAAPPPVQSPPPAGASPDRRSDSFSFGDLDAEIVGCEVLDEAGNAASVFHAGEGILIRVKVALRRDLTHLNVGFRLRNKEGVKIYSWGTFNQDVEIWNGTLEGEAFWERSFQQGDVLTVEFRIPCHLGHNLYEVQAVAAQERQRFFGSQRMLHWRDEAAFFHVHVQADRHFFGGVCDLRGRARLYAVRSGRAAQV